MPKAFRKESVSYVVAGDRIAADLYLPAEAQRVAPAVVTGPGFAGVKEMVMGRYGEALARAGIICLSIDYRGWGSSEGLPRQDLSPSRQVEDLKAGLDFLTRRPDVDATRLGVWGTSMGGGHALTLAASDARIKVAVAMIPYLHLPPVQADGFRLLVRSAVAALLDGFSSSPATVPVFAEHRGMSAVMTSDGGWQWMQDVIANAPTYRNCVTARSLMRLLFYRPVSLAARIRTPLLLIAARDDTITPAAPIRSFGKALRGVSKYIEIPGTHFDLFGQNIDQSVNLTVDWFQKHL